MIVVRALARPMLSAAFVSAGVKALRNPEPLVPGAQPVADRMVPLVRRVAPAQISDHLPESTKNLVRLNGAIHVLGGLALATGSGRRLAATVLAATLVPTTLAEHRFWEAKDKAERAEQRTHFVKNLGLFGGLLLAAVDTEGKPGIAWRTTHGARAVKRGAGRTTRHAKHEAKHAMKAAKREAKLAAKAARREVPFAG